MTHSFLIPSSTPKTVDAYVRSEEEIAFRAFLDDNLAGQNEAKEAVVSILNAIRDPLRDPKKPIDSSLFIGPSTAGKTRAFKLLVQWIHGDEEKMMFFSGSDFMEMHQIQKLIGAPHGYHGYVDPEDPKRRAPQPGETDHSAMLSQHNMNNSKLNCKEDIIFVLFDEWEKFHFAFNLFMLRPLREGTGSLNNGQPVNFRNVVMCFTSNLAAGELEKMKTPMGFRSFDKKVITSGEVRKTVIRELVRGYPPEFRNRIDRIVCFTELGDNELIKVVDIELKAFNNRVLALPKDKIFILSVDHSAKLFMLDRDKQAPTQAGEEKSAIPAMQQAMKSLLSEPLGRLVRRGVIHGGDRVEVSHKEGDDKFTFEIFADPLKAVVEAAIKEAGGVIGDEAVSADSDGSTGADAARDAGAAGPGSSAGDTDTAPRDTSGSNAGAEKSPAEQGGATTPTDADQSFPLQSQSVIVQDFVILLRASDNLHADLKLALLNGLASSPFIKVTEDSTRYGDVTEMAGVVVKINVTMVQVLAPIELMFALKRSMPCLTISTVASPIEL